MIISKDSTRARAVWVIVSNVSAKSSSFSTGLNHIDIDYCKSKGIKVLSHTEDMRLLEQLPSTAELAIGLMLSIGLMYKLTE